MLSRCPAAFPTPPARPTRRTRSRGLPRSWDWRPGTTFRTEAPDRREVGFADGRSSLPVSMRVGPFTRKVGRVLVHRCKPLGAQARLVCAVRLGVLPGWVVQASHQSTSHDMVNAVCDTARGHRLGGAKTTPPGRRRSVKACDAETQRSNSSSAAHPLPPQSTPCPRARPFFPQHRVPGSPRLRAGS